MAYAETTRVPFEKTVSDIITMLRKAGAAQVGQMEEDGRLTILFGLADRQIRFRVTWDDTVTSKKQRARALFLVIKAKLESVVSEVETFEQAFLANIVMHDGKTVHERVSSDMALEYRSGQPKMYLLSSQESEA